MKFLILSLLFIFFGSLIFIIPAFTIYEAPYNSVEFFEKVQPSKINLSNPEMSRLPLKEGTQQIIIWSKNRQNIPADKVISFIHGFTGNRSEMDPFISELQNDIDANLFYARLPGHGLLDGKIQSVTVSDWFYSVLDIWSYSKELGKKRIYIGLSTGAGISLMIAQKYDPEACLVLVSPNFALKNKWTGILSGRLGYPILGALVGLGTNDFYTVYPPETHPMNSPLIDSASINQFLEITRIFRTTDWSNLQNQILVIHAPDDDVVDTDIIRKKLSGPNVQILEMGRGHNLFDWKSIEQTKVLKTTIVSFINERCN
ncbi:MAG: alpha/beta hydrolase [Bdellovibrionaceae bacterium]|nr:alpha/beta hydrolase [Pseudobdellovibrionaceae bacterium]